MRIFRHYISWNLLFLVLVESLLIFSSFCASHLLKEYFNLDFVWPEYGFIYAKAFAITLITVIIFYVGGLYDLRLHLRRGELCTKITICFFITAFVAAAIGFFVPTLQLGRQNYLFSLFVFLPIVVLFRLFYSWAMQIAKEKVLILGTSDVARLIFGELTSGHYPGYEVQGFVVDNTLSNGPVPPEMRILGHVKDLQDIVHHTKPGVLVVALSERRGTFPYREILDCKLSGIRVEDWPTFYEKLTGKIIIHNLRPSWLIFSDGFAVTRLAPLLKRVTDVVLSIIGLCIALPIMAVVSICIKLSSVGPVFFRQERVGENGKNFTLTKFRTMVTDAEKDTGPVWAQGRDPRVTKLGNVLRRTGLDEIPQLFNVLKGDMSFVGPRPERPHFVEELQEKIPYYALRLTVKPGITGWAQVRYGYGANVEDAIEKLQYDLYYIKNMSFFLDLLVVLSTVHKVLFAKVAVQSDANERSQYLPLFLKNRAEHNDVDYGMAPSLRPRARETARTSGGE